MRLFLALLALSFAGCSNVNQSLNPDTYYRRDIKVTVNGVKFKGVGVPLPASKYEMEIESKGVINMLTITTCHREVQIEQDDPGWFEKGNKVKYTYIPVSGLEDGKSCLMEIGVFEQKKGRHGWALLDFRVGPESVQAELTCDGKKEKTAPVSICQSREGLLQRIKFDRKMKVLPDLEKPQCTVMETSDSGFTYDFLAAPGECVYYFGDQNKNFHKLTVAGFQSILIRED